MSDDRILARVAALREKFVGELARDRDELQAVRSAPAGNPALMALLHRLAGRAGTFGFPEISDVAGRLEALCAGDAGTDQPEPLFDSLDQAIAAVLGEKRR